MRVQHIVIALSAALLVASSIGHAQSIAPSAGTMNPASHVILEMSGFNSESEAKILGPANFLEQLRNGTLRELELEVSPGPLNDALARTHRTRARLNSIGLSANPGTGQPVKVEMKNVLVTAYSFSSDRDKSGRVTFQFQIDVGAPAADIPPASWMTTLLPSMDQSPLYDGAGDGKDPKVAARGGSAGTQTGDGFADIIVGAGPARLASPGALQSLTVGGATNQPIAIEVQRGSPLERLLRSSLAGRKAIPELKLELSAPDSETRVVVTLFKGRVVGIRPGNSVGMEQVTIAYEHMTRIAP